MMAWCQQFFTGRRHLATLDNTPACSQCAEVGQGCVLYWAGLTKSLGVCEVSSHTVPLCAISLPLSQLPAIAACSSKSFSGGTRLL